ncbi:MAG: alpha/beta hydrolase [Thomasclavelia sp.]|jgi:alpha-beta hydrolase superfamily lysophospholipase|nr:alpha/beta hydrolase [Thomasclavelia sp.]
MISEKYSSASGTYVNFDLYLPRILIRYKGIIQIHHALNSHSRRYKKFAEYLANVGYVVVVSDFPGHGTSLFNFEQGYFGRGDATKNLVSDMHRLRNLISKRYPDLPYYIIADGFATLVLKIYMVVYGDYINGAVLIGTNGKAKNTKLRKAIVETDSKLRGGLMHRSQTFKKRAHKKLSKRTSKGEDYRMSDEEEIRELNNDPFTNVTYTNQALLDIINLMNYTSQDSLLQRTPSYLPIYIVSGKIDAFGDFGKGPTWLYNKYKTYGLKDVTLKIYPGLKKDILHATSRRDIYLDIVTWLEERSI